MAVPGGFNPNRGEVLIEGPMISLNPARTVARPRGGTPDRPRKAVSTCRDEVVAAVMALTERTAGVASTGGQIYAEMVATGMRHPKSTVLKTIQRMKGLPSRPPYVQLERVGTSGFRLLQSGA